MKIAHLVSTFPPYMGGMGNAAFQMASHLAILGHDITVITPDYGHTPPSEQSGFHVMRVKPKLAYGNSGWLPGLATLLDGYDLVHLHYPFIGAESILATSQPIVVTYQMDLNGRGWKRPWFYCYQKFFLPRLARRSARFIFSSKDYYDFSLAKGIVPLEKSRFIPLGVDEFFMPGPNDQAPGTQTSSAPIPSAMATSPRNRLLFVGGLDKAHYFKGLHVLFEALARVDSQVVLAIVGDGDLKLTYQESVKRLGLQNVHFFGRASREELRQQYQNCDFLVLPSIDSSEAFGLVLVEAMACAKPVLASDLPGVRTIIEQNNVGMLAKPGDAADLAAKISMMLMADLPAMGQNARKKVLEQFSWPSIAQQIEKVYTEIL